MLAHLSIKNYALIHHLEMDFSDGLNVVTGETGTGKSIVLGAIGLLLGNRADAKVLSFDDKKCIVEGTFKLKGYQLKTLFEKQNLDYDDQAVLRREIVYGGKSRAFINDTPATLEVMKKIGLKLMNIHSQHETIELKNRLFQLHIIDLYADNSAYQEAYQAAWERYTSADKDYHHKVEKTGTLQKEVEFMVYQLEELKAVDLEQINQEQLEGELKIMENAEDIKIKLSSLLSKLEGSECSVDNIFTEIRTLFNPLGIYSEEYNTLYKRFESLWIELKDITSEIRNKEDNIDYDSKHAEKVKEQLNLLYRLLHKHQFDNVAQLHDFQKNLQDNVDKHAGIEDALGLAKQVLQEAAASLEDAAKKLSASRSSIFQIFCKQIVNLLWELGIPHAKLHVEHQKNTAGKTGIDQIDLLFSANKGISERPLAEVASGGEFSRFMFCVQYVLAKKTALPTLILDEIDNGISGETAIRLGSMMKTMAIQCQLLAISHLPQIAAKADRHFYVYKKPKGEKIVSHIRLLDKEEQIAEIAKMISGKTPSPSAMASARELMKS